MCARSRRAFVLKLGAKFIVRAWGGNATLLRNSAVFADGAGNTPLLNVNGNGSTPGTAFSVSLENTGSAETYIMDDSVDVAETPIPPSAFLLIPGFIGVIGLRKRIKG